MICHVPESERDLWLCDVEFAPASPEDIDTGFLGWVSCVVSHRLCLCGMRVRRLSTGRIKIKVRRGCRDMEERLVAIDATARGRIQELIIADEEFRVALEAIGVEVPEATDA